MKISETFNSLYKAEAAGWKKQKKIRNKMKKIIHDMSRKQKK